MKHHRKKEFRHERGSPGWWQELHSPTVPVEIKISGERTKQVARRRKQDARLFDGLDPLQEQAMLNIERGFQIASSGLGIKVMAYEERIPGTAPEDRAADMREYYMAWHIAAYGNFCAPTVLDIIAFGKSIREVAIERRMGRETVKRHFDIGIQEYCILRGWMKKMH